MGWQGAIHCIRPRWLTSSWSGAGERGVRSPGSTFTYLERGVLFVVVGDRTNGAELDLVSAPSARLRDLSDELFAYQALQRDARAFVEVRAQARFEDASSL